VPELPDHLDVSVTLGGAPLDGAWVELHLPMERKHDYVLLVGPGNAAGALTLSRADLENQISVIQLSAFMDYSSLGVWRGELILTPFDTSAIQRARERQAAWPPALLAAYPTDFDAQMTALAQRVAGQPGLSLEVSATATGGTAHLTCRSVST
jgi:hypothetical protein